MRRYTLLLLGLMLLLLAGVLCIASFGIDQCALRDRSICGLYHYQEAKLAAAPGRIDTLFVGDSSLGNAIDARQFAASSGRTTLSLALSGGALGLPAISTQLGDAVRHMRIANLVIMVSPEDYRRRFGSSADGYVFANHGHLRRLLSISPVIALQSLGALIRFLFNQGTVADGWHYLTTGERDLGDCNGCAARDYIAQHPSGELTSDDIKKWRGPFRDFDPFLERIEAICARERINCLYVHGPLVQAILDVNPGYLAAVDQNLAKIGITPVSPGPLIIAPDEVGDSVNHVKPELRGTYTERYYRELAPLLK
jgi:hypothetical protein